MIDPNMLRVALMGGTQGAPNVMPAAAMPDPGAGPDPSMVAGAGGGPGWAQPPADAAPDLGMMGLPVTAPTANNVHPAVAAAATQPKPQPGIMKQMLLDFMGSFREQLQKQMGVPTDTERQALKLKQQIEQQREQRDALFQQAQTRNIDADNLRQNRELNFRIADAQARAKAAAEKPTKWEENKKMADQMVAAGVIKAGSPEYLEAASGGTVKKDNSTSEFEQYVRNYGPEKGLKLYNEAMIERARQSRPPKDSAAANNAASQKSYQYHNTQLDKLAQPIDQFNMRFDRLKQTLDQKNMTADALAPPELMTVMAGGTGSGLRINEAEISRVLGGRTVWEGLKAQLQQWSLNPDQAVSITDAQRGQMKKLMNEVQRQMTEKSNIINDARESIANSDDPAEHRRIYSKARRQFSGGASDDDAAAAPVSDWSSVLPNSTVKAPPRKR